MSDCIKDFILPEFITDPNVCEEELNKINDNIEYLNDIRSQYLLKLAELTNQKVFRQDLDCNCTIYSYHVTDKEENVDVTNEYFNTLRNIDDIIEENETEEID